MNRLSYTSTCWERTPWHATQRAAWEALGRRDNADALQTRLPVVRLSIFRSGTCGAKIPQCENPVFSRVKSISTTEERTRLRLRL